MDTSVALAQACLHFNGHFTIAEYPVLEAFRGERVRSVVVFGVGFLRFRTGALDVTTGVVVLRAIADVNREIRATTALITHNATIASMADRVIQLADGRTVGDRRNDRRVPPEELR